MMTWSPSSSSMLISIGHDPETNELGFVFRRTPGKRYIYAGVDAKKHAALVTAESHGRYAQQHIIGKHDHRVEEIEQESGSSETESAGAR